MKIKLKSLKILVIAITLSMSLTACNSNDSSDNTSKKANYTVFELNDTQLDNSVLTFIKGQLYEGDNYFNAGIAITGDDRYNRVEILDKYTCENAVYYKTHITDGNGDFYCMYRFQMGTQGKIESYIKYVLEA